MPSKDARLIVFRDQDSYEPSLLQSPPQQSHVRRSEGSANGKKTGGCTHDDLSWNMGEDHRIHRQRFEQLQMKEELRFAREMDQSLSGLTGLTGLRKRQDAAGSLGIDSE